MNEQTEHVVELVELVELVDAIYEWVEFEIVDNILQYFRPTFIDDCIDDAVAHFSDLIIQCDMDQPTHPVRYTGLRVLLTKGKRPKAIPIIIADDDSDASIECESDLDTRPTVDLVQAVQTAVEEVLTLYHIPPRSTYQCSEPIDDHNLGITAILDGLAAIKYPAQRSPEWYQSRIGLFSASSLYKLFGSESLYNSLIYEKCNPDAGHVNHSQVAGPSEATNPMSWGVKYESVSAAIYTHKNPGTVVRTDYGCIKHPVYSCIGASPDGINISHLNLNKYGRMVEIKNIVNRDITGIPKWEYWIQMQFQMEVCRLSKCDFVETRFVEYHSAEDFYSDEVEYKGVILYFMPIMEPVVPIMKQTGWLGGMDDIDNIDTSKKIIMSGFTGSKTEDTSKKDLPSAEFVYMPLYVRVDEPWAVAAYIEEQRNARIQTHTISSISYWCLEEYSCVTVDHNPAWIQSAIPVVLDAWKIVETERPTNSNTRAPKRRVNKMVDECGGEKSKGCAF